MYAQEVIEVVVLEEDWYTVLGSEVDQLNDPLQILPVRYDPIPIPINQPHDPAHQPIIQLPRQKAEGIPKQIDKVHVIDIPPPHRLPLPIKPIQRQLTRMFNEEHSKLLKRELSVTVDVHSEGIFEDVVEAGLAEFREELAQDEGELLVVEMAVTVSVVF